MSNTEFCTCDQVLTRARLSEQGKDCTTCFKTFRVVIDSEVSNPTSSGTQTTESIHLYQNTISEIEHTKGNEKVDSRIYQNSEELQPEPDTKNTTQTGRKTLSKYSEDLSTITLGITDFHLADRPRSDTVKSEGHFAQFEPVYERVRSTSFGSQVGEDNHIRKVETHTNLARDVVDSAHRGYSSEQSSPGDRVTLTDLLRHERRLANNMQEHEGQAVGIEGPNRLGYQNLKLRPPRFEGKKSENVKHFISKFEKYATHQRVEQDNYSDCIGLFLEGAALEFYDYTRRQNEEMEYEELKVALINRFDDDQFSLIIKNKLHSRKLKPSEKVTDYYNDLLSLSTKIDLSDDDFLYIFLNGLTPQLREHVVCRGPTSVAEAVQIAKTLEQVKVWGKTANETKSVYETIRADIEKDKAVTCALSSDRKEIQDMKRTMLEIQESLAKMQSKQDDNFRPNDNKGYSQFQANTPWKQNGYQRFNNRQTYRPQFAAGGGTRSFGNRGNFRQNRFQSNRPDFSNQFKHGSTNQSRNWQRGNFSTGANQSNWRKEQEAKQEANGACAQTKDKEEKPDPKVETSNNNSVANAVADLENCFGDMVLIGEIAGVSVRCLVDTGSTLNIISEEIVQKLESRPRIMESEYDKVVAVNQSETSILGAIQEKIRLGTVEKTVKFHILPKSNHDIILGRKFIFENVKLIDFEKSEVTFQEAEGRVAKAAICSSKVQNKQIETATAKVANRVKIRAGKTCDVRIYPSNNILNERLRFEGGRLLKDLGLSTEPQVVPGAVNFMTVKIRNDSQDDKTLYPNRKMGILTVVKRASVAALDTPLEKSKIKHNVPNLDTEEIRRLIEFLDSRRTVFSVNNTELGTAKSVMHEIRVHTDKPIRSTFYRANKANQDKIDQHIRDLLEHKIIQPSASPWASPCILVPKTDNTTRFVVDFRRLNKVTIHDSYPLPLIQDILDGLGGAKYFSTLDLTAGYHQILVEPNSRKYTAFIVRGGLYEYLRMPFGLSEASQTFVRLMEKVLHGLNYKIAFSYLDDIIVFSDTVEEHIKRLDLIFDRLEAEGLTLKPTKCVFLRESVEFLGHVISGKGIEPNPKKIKVVQDQIPPKDKKQVKSFLGLAGYYRKFVRDFSKIAFPLTRLLKKDTAFEWSNECERAFNTLKEKLVTAPVLAFPDFEKPFILYTDSSGFAMGMILGQLDSLGREVVVSFAGRTLNKHEVNYTVTEQEALAVITGVKHFEHYLVGRKFTVITDHTALVWLLTQKQPRGRIARWILTLQSFDFTVKHKPGVSHKNADAISRITNLPEVLALDANIFTQENIKDKQREDKTLAPLIKLLESKGIHEDAGQEEDMGNKFLLDEQGILWISAKEQVRNNANSPYRLVIPESLKKQVLINFHDDLTAGHLGFDKSYGKISLRYWWDGMYKDVKNWCKSCESCAMVKPRKGVKVAPLQPIAVKGPFESVQVDFVGPFNTSKSGNKHIIVYTDSLTKWVEASAVPTTSAEHAIRTLFEQVIARHSCPRRLLSDLGKAFISNMLTELCKILEVDKRFSSAYHPMTQGQCERLNGTIVSILSNFANKNMDNWDELLPGALLAYRTAPHAVTKYTPFYLLYGRLSIMPTDVSLAKPPTLNEKDSACFSRVAKNIWIAQNMARQDIQSQKQNMKERYDQKAKETTLKVGDEVYLKVGVTQKGKNKKLLPKYSGPFKLIEKTSPVNFRIDNSKNKRMNDIIHVNRMKKKEQRKVHVPENVQKRGQAGEAKRAGNDDKVVNPIETKEGGKKREQVEVINHRRTRRGLLYLVKTIGAPEVTAVWTEAGNEKYQDEIQMYIKNQGGEKQQIVNCLSTTRNTYTFTTKTVIMCFTVIITLLGLIKAVKSGEPALRAIYDCDITTIKGIYARPSQKRCQQNFHSAKIRKYTAEILKFKKVTTVIRIFYCDARKITKDCQENFWGTEVKAFDSKFIRVGYKTCRKALKSGQTPYGKIKRNSENEWVASHTKRYKCSWMTDNKQTYTLFRMRSYEATIEGDDRFLHQHLTATDCVTSKLRCIPKEQRLGILIWNKSNHDFNLFHSLGVHEVHQIRNFVLLSNLGVGGSIIANKEGEILLDNAYMLRKTNTSGNSSTNKPLEKFATKYAKTTIANVQRDLMEGRLSEGLMEENKVITSLAAMVCDLNSKVQALVGLNIHSFPDTLDKFLYEQGGHIIEPRGDAVIIKKCKQITEYKIIWDRKLNNTCYSMIPIILEKGITKFLELSTKRTIASALKVNCTHRPREIYIKDKDDHYWKHSTEKGFTRVKLDNKFATDTHLVMPKLASYNERLLHYSKARPHRTTLLDMLHMQQESLNTVTDLREAGKGSFAQGIARAMSDIFETLEQTGTNVFDLIADGVVTVTNDTVLVAEETGSLIKNIFAFTGGASNFVLYIINFGIIAYLTHRHFKLRCGGQRRKYSPTDSNKEHTNHITDLNEEHDAISQLPPPLPLRDKTISSE